MKIFGIILSTNHTQWRFQGTATPRVVIAMLPQQEEANPGAPRRAPKLYLCVMPFGNRNSGLQKLAQGC